MLNDSDLSNDTDVAEEPSRRFIIRSDSCVLKDKMTGLKA